MGELKPYHLTVMDVYQEHLMVDPHQPAISWIPERSGEQVTTLNREQFFEACKGIAAGLLQLPWNSQKPAMAILAFSPGLDFIKSFLACQLAGVIAVPIAMPRKGRDSHILEAIVANCNADIVLTGDQDVQRLSDIFNELQRPESVSVYGVQQLAISPGGGVPFSQMAQEYAFIQYTSGSSSLPKGVLVKHQNLLANLQLISVQFKFCKDSMMANWLPHYHDMGLIGGLLTPISQGILSVSMSPTAFIKRPLRWLQMISEQTDKRVTSGGPNFAYQLCADRIGDDELVGLDLANWKTAYNGAEPIRAETLEQFSCRFSQVGFARECLLPCYGLAETTLFATGDHNPRMFNADVKGIESGVVKPARQDEQGRVLVASGHADTDRVAIVDPETQELLPEGHIGDIWLSGPSVPDAYFNNPEQSQKTFQARLQNNPQKRFVVTGDIGAIVNGHLYVTGRRKELIIVNGRNIYPQDVESLLLKSIEEIEAVAVFAVEQDNSKGEEIVVICELPRNTRSWFDTDSQQNISPQLQDMANKIRRVTAALEISIAHLRFVGPMGVKKTTSGKISYGVNRREFAELPDDIRLDKCSAKFSSR